MSDDLNDFKVMFAYLPLPGDGYLCLSQNRFAKFRGDRELIYPIVPASGVTLLDRAGFRVRYLDSIFQGLDEAAFLRRVEAFSPDLLVFESKTPSIVQNWAVSDMVKEHNPSVSIAAVGDHVSVLPGETLRRSKVDFVITGGDFDVGMLDLAKHLAGQGSLPQGVHYREDGEIVNTGPPRLIPDLDALPFIDRELVPWQNYHESWRLYDPFMYMMAGRGCPYRCTFCSWPQMLYGGKVRFRSVQNVMEEVKLLVERYGAREIFFDDDTFTSNRSFVLAFSAAMQEADLGVAWGCNGRVDNVDPEVLGEMKRAGCRIIKFGIESASQDTLDRIQKGYTIDQVRRAFADAKEAGIFRHGTVMIGYPWETEEDIRASIEFVKELNVDSVQFSIPMAYPGTKLFREAKEKGWLRFPEGDWTRYDMSLPSLINPQITAERTMELCSLAWREVYFRPSFVLKKVLNLRSLAQMRLFIRGLRSVARGHLLPLG